MRFRTIKAKEQAEKLNVAYVAIKQFSVGSTIQQICRTTIFLQ